MANSLYNLALDFSKELNYTKAIMARQGDKGITVTVKPFLNGLQMDTSGGTFTLKGTTPSNRYVDSVATSVTSEEVTFSLDGTFMSEAGYYKHCYVEYRKDNQILTTQDIIFFSLGVSDISQGQADEYVSQLEELIRKYNETFDAFMAEIKGRVNSLNKQITDLTGQAKTLQDKLDALKEEISKLGNLQVMYSNSIEFGDYDYSGNPNIAPVINDENVKSLNNTMTTVTGHGTYATAEKIGNNLTIGIGMAPWDRYDFSKLTVGKQYTLTIPIRINADYTGDISKLFIRIRCANTDGDVLVNTKTLPSNSPKEEIVDVSTTFTVPSTVQKSNNWYCQVGSLGDSDARGTVDISYNVKLEEGSAATPYQPNLLEAPYYLSKVALGENIADPTVIFPIKTSAYRLYGVNMLEEFKVGQRYTLTMKANKPVSQTFWAYNGENISLERMTPVEGLVDVWSCSFTPLTVDTSSPRLLSIYQAPQSTVGTCQIDWLKIEKGDTRTPNIEQYKYRGIGMRDSNNPKDYVWDLAPEYVEAEVTKKVAQVNSQLKEHVNDTNNPHEVTKNQVGLGNVDNFSTATQTEAEKGEASNKFMTPQRTTQMITKRIATDAEVVAGTDLNKLVTPKSLDIYYRDRTQVAVASYGTEDIALTAKEELSEASWRYRRIGDIVEFYGRFKLKEATDIVNVHELPTGFRLSTDFDDTSWNVPLNIQKAANPTSYVAGAFVERQGTNLLRVGGNSSGNHYVSGWWYTDDPFPTG
ncbi:BppU family phage baseplate upper protein [Enterococcus hirae]|uniref:BppU family phage baseplate upper protein n=1 Tax=Enterococcus hirae TaxID=1354 RepID=UPI003FD5D749